MAENGEETSWGDNVDENAFMQILEMDDDEDSREFSKSLVYGFFEQAEGTFESMDKALEAKDLNELASLGHFLKGSSATLGYTKVKIECEKIQNLGHMKDATGQHDETDADKNLRLVKQCIQRAKESYKEVELLMRQYYGDP